MFKIQSKIILVLIYFTFFIIEITYQNIIGFYQTFNTDNFKYNWTRCHEKCYTCNEAPVGPNNQNCLSCDFNKGLYFIENNFLENNLLENNCYSQSECENSTHSCILDNNQNPPKWVKCHENCQSCTAKVTYNLNHDTIIQMNCDKCKDGYIKVNTFCYQKVSGDAQLGFFLLDGTTKKYCGDFKDDQTGQQLGIFHNGNECIIKPENSYFINNDKNKLLKYCNNNCIICEGLSGSEDSKCLKCKNNYVFSPNSNECTCPFYLGLDSSSNCVNCKYSPSNKYNLNGVCVPSKLISDVNYALINSTYNIISKCKRPCLNCDSNGRCITCRTNYFLDNIAKDNSQINDNTKICLTYNECLDLGFPNEDFNLCIFCENQNYKLPNSDSCIHINDLDDYYVKKEGYNSLGYCHDNCLRCSKGPKGNKQQNCISCKSHLVYNSTTNNCDEQEIEIIEDKCPNLLYYIDEEETDNDKKKKCVSEGDLCPNKYPYLIQSLQLCVKKCLEIISITWDKDIPTLTYNLPENEIFKNILDNICIHFSSNLDYINDFWTFFDNTITTRQYSIFNFFNNYYGRILTYNYNDDESLYVFGEDTTFHITKLSHENSFILSKDSKNNKFLYNSNSNYFNNYYSFINYRKYNTYRSERRVSIIYLAECEKIIKRLNNLESTDLIILKLDLYRNDTKNGIAANKVKYKIYHPYSFLELDLDICKNYPINIITPISYFNDDAGENLKLLNILRNVVNEGYEPFILYSNFYTETCEQFSNEKNVDVTLKDRRKDIYEKVKSFKFCQKGCYYQSTDENVNFINCICSVDTSQNYDLDEDGFNSIEEENENNYLNAKLLKKLEDIEKSKINDYFNFYLTKCFRLLFSEEGFYHNYACMIIIALFILYILFMLFYFCLGFDIYINELKKILFIKYLGKDEIKKNNNNQKTIIKNESNISLDEEEDMREKETNIYRYKNIQNRTNSDNIYNREKKFNVKNQNKWIRENKSSILAHPIKDDQIKVVNNYDYKNNDLYRNKDNIIIDYQNENNKNVNNDIIGNNAAPPKRKGTKNNNYYHMGNNNDLINARTVKPITKDNYDFIQTLIKGKEKSVQNEENIIDNNNNIIGNIEEVNEEEEEIESNNKYNSIFNKKSKEQNTSPAIYIYNLILEEDNLTSTMEEQEEQEISNIITQREYSFLNDGEINELDYDNAFVHDKRSFIRIYYSFIKYNILIYFSFLVYEDFNINFAKIALFINYLILYLTFNTMFFNNNSIHNIYINEGKYNIGYHMLRILGAFVLSLIFIKLIRIWITFYRRKSLNMKLMKRYTDSKNEILKMIEKYSFNIKIYFPISIVVNIFFCYYVSVVCAVYRYSHKYLIVNWIICIVFHIVYSLILNIIPTILRYLSLKENQNKDKRKTMYTASRILSYFL